MAIPGFLPTLESAERLALVLSNSTTPPDANSDSREALAENAHSGQGFITDTATKLAIEEAAMRAAIAHYSALHWEVEDVSRTASYDIHCTRGREELRVEVKGTTGLATAVLLTPNEVSHALENAGRVALYVLSSIETSMQDGVVFATGGIPQIREPWELDIRQLSPTGYSYSL
ncbi:DUF3883 domain-containing protein [Gordonia jacobaea]|uniref:DUF3883 domain-containing protein n=1 Tax=Gordonia jacobaea TaxID=122202 RepID=UPI003D7584F9